MKNKIFLVLFSVAFLYQGKAFSAAPPLNQHMREEIVMVPSGSGLFSVKLETTIFKPPGDGPFPLVIVNHGKAAGIPAFQARARYLVISKEFLQRGYAVIIPMRKGFSKSGGLYVDGGCNITGNGNAQADDLQSALDYALQQPWVDESKILIMGQSHGGLTTMAFGARNPVHVKALVNFAGGLRYDSMGCSWRPALVDAFERYGKTTRIPSLWFYGANDSYFNPELARQMHEAYIKSGADAKLIAYGAFKQDSHGMSSSPDGVVIWWPETEVLLKKVGLPTEKTVVIEDAADLPKTDFAKLEDAAAVPFLDQTGRRGYEFFLTRVTPRAFAISSSGQWSSAWGGESPVERALNNCRSKTTNPCRLYAIDQHVVWVDETAAAQRTK